MADWNAYRRQAIIAGLREARAIAHAIGAEAEKGRNPVDRGQRRASVRITGRIDARIDELEAEARQTVYTHFMEEPRDG